ncbi:MAG: PQQ-dependent sugar dehydrogenase [Solirubrobacterales bacterium]
MAGCESSDDASEEASQADSAPAPTASPSPDAGTQPTPGAADGSPGDSSTEPPAGGASGESSAEPPAGNDAEGSSAEDPGASQEVKAVSNGELRLEPIGKFRSPLHVAQPPGDDGLLVVAEKQGRLIAVRDGRVRERPFLDLHSRVRHQGTEQGLVAVAFAPDYRKSRLMYVSYTGGKRGDLRIEEFKVPKDSPNRADIKSRRTVMVIKQPHPIHNGGLIVFGPDKKLYIAAGDGGPSHDPFRRPQDRKQLFGKLLRIDPEKQENAPYGVPKGNPYAGPRRGQSEIYAIGLRNPWRFSFDRERGLLTLGDVGQDFWEEINTVSLKRARGANFGWSGFEGTKVFNPDQKRKGTIKPALTYLHGPRGCSVTGGYVVRDPMLPDLDGLYLYGDFCEGELRTLDPRPGKDGKDVRKLGLPVPAPVSFGEDNEGRIYVASLSGPVYRLEPA